MQFQEKSTQCKNNSHSQFDLCGRRHYFLDDRHVPCPSFDGAANLPWGKWLGEGDYLAFHNYQEFECLSALLQVFHLTEDYDKAIIPYQTKPYALNVTAEIYLRSVILR